MKLTCAQCKKEITANTDNVADLCFCGQSCSDKYHENPANRVKIPTFADRPSPTERRLVGMLGA